MRTALVVGGSGATGVEIADGLRGRGYEVTVYHRGLHEDAGLADLEHIHGDPHVPGAIARELRWRAFDVTVATYGLIGHIVRELRGRTGHLVAVSCLHALDPRPGIPISEDDPYASGDAPGRKLARRVVDVERAVLDAHAAGELTATVVRYPYVYGPRAVAPMEWHILKRVLDGRRRWSLPAGGLTLTGRCASPNAARLIGLVLDNPQAAGGQVYHAADTRQYTMREWITMVAGAAGHEFDFVDIPPAIVPAGVSAVPMARAYRSGCSRTGDEAVLRHALVSSEKARSELGYEDVVTPEEWIRRSVEHWLRHPPAVETDRSGPSPQNFDYAAEDALLAFWDEVVAHAPVEGFPDPRETRNGHGHHSNGARIAAIEDEARS
jgi:nucleoside-diphosphate-sugar epimerase